MKDALASCGGDLSAEEDILDNQENYFYESGKCVDLEGDHVEG